MTRLSISSFVLSTRQHEATRSRDNVFENFDEMEIPDTVDGTMLLRSSIRLGISDTVNIVHCADSVVGVAKIAGAEIYMFCW